MKCVCIICLYKLTANEEEVQMLRWGRRLGCTQQRDKIFPTTHEIEKKKRFASKLRHKGELARVSNEFYTSNWPITDENDG